MRVAILQFPGSNCDDDALHVIKRVLVEEAEFVWHKRSELPAGTDAVIVPGGFSYGDYLRSGAIAAQAAIMDAVRAFAAAGAPVLGICNGFQILCEAGLLPGALARNASLRFECRHVYVRVEGKPTPFTSAIPAGLVLRLPIAHADGRYINDDPQALGARGQVTFRYCDAAGGVKDDANPNGSQLGIAGVCLQPSFCTSAALIVFESAQPAQQSSPRSPGSRSAGGRQGGRGAAGGWDGVKRGFLFPILLMRLTT